MTTKLVQNLVTREFEPARYGVGYGGMGVWLNRHFATVEDAQTFFDEQVAGTVAAYQTPALRGRHSVTDISKGQSGSEKWAPHLLRAVRVQNTKKDGKPGKIRNDVHLYEVTE